MKYIERSLYKVKCKEKFFLQVAYIVNVTVICVLVMIATGISNVTNESLSTNDLQQIENILSSVIFISVLTITFFQWVISMQFRALFDSRIQFNNNLRLLGAPSKFLLKIYIKEMVCMQPVSIILGWCFGETIYYFLAEILNIENKLIGAMQLLIALLLHVLVITLCITFTYKKTVSKSVVDSMRRHDERESGYKIDKIRTIMGIGVLLISLLLLISNEIDNIKPLALLGIVVSIFILFKTIVYVCHVIILKIAKQFRASELVLSEFISLGYLKKCSTVSMLIFFSISLFLGLQMLFQNVRMCGVDVVENNIHYEATVWQSEKEIADNIHSSDLRGEVYTGLKYKVKNQGSTWYIHGISIDFFEMWETINLCNYEGDDINGLINRFNDEDWNGILLPETYINEADIGSLLDVKIGDKVITFKIVGSYYSNNLAHWNFFASKAYIQKELGVQGQCNMVYLKNHDDIISVSNEQSVIETYEDIRKESYEQAVNGTSLVEMMSIVIMICALLALLNFIMLSSRNDIIDIAKFKGIGMTTFRVCLVYIYETLIPLALSMLVAIPVSIVFAKCACLAVLDSYYFQRDFIIPYDMILIIFSSFGGISILFRMLSLMGATDNKRYIRILRDIKE